MKKSIVTSKGIIKVSLVKEGMEYIVYCGKDVYYRCYNELFAISAFNEI